MRHVCGMLVASGAVLLANTALASTIVVTPGSLNGWGWTLEGGGSVGTGQFVDGPAAPPAGTGSFQFTTASGGSILWTTEYNGVRLADITALSYATYQAPTSAGTVQAIALQFNVDYDLTDVNGSWQGRLVFEPYQTPNNTVNKGVWQTWNPMAGRWWATGAPGNASFPQATPSSWNDILAAFPNIGIHQTLGSVIFKAGSGWPAGFDGNVDAFTMAVNQRSTTWDFELREVPEPGSLLLLGLGLAGAVRRIRR